MDCIMMTPEQIADFQRDGAVVVRGAFTDWLDVMAEGVAQNMAEPGPYASENSVTAGRFFDDYCNWTRIAAFERLVRESPAAALAASAMQSQTAQFFHDHVLVKEPGTPKPTPWHQDAPYYFVGGQQTVSIWMPLDPVREASLRLVAGSHRWDRLVRPVSWADDSDFYEGTHDWIPVPDPDADPGASRVLEWPMDPGDAVLFDFRTVHGARGNASDQRRRAVSLRWVGDDARYVARPGRTSPPFPGHGMTEGQVLRTDWFPVIHGAPEK
jgi:ectoine hydroxylase-related dioxygenase (phytanoyl-CoA dioxygenase family)